MECKKGVDVRFYTLSPNSVLSLKKTHGLVRCSNKFVNINSSTSVFSDPFNCLFLSHIFGFLHVDSAQQVTDSCHCLIV